MPGSSPFFPTFPQGARMDIAAFIRNVPDYPKPGILF